MPWIHIIMMLFFVGMGLWSINTSIPMASNIKIVVNAAIVISLCVWILKAAGL